MDSILKRALDSALIEIEVVNLRDYSNNKHYKVDDFQIGGGAGLVICGDVLCNALNMLKTPDSHIIFLTPSAKLFNTNDSRRLSKYKHIILICGRYEGIDERVVEEFVDEVFCIGDFILTGGELPALAVCDSVSRYINGVLGNSESLLGESFENNLLEAPIFTKNIDSKNKFNFSYPLDYSKGNHSRINALKYELSLRKTKYFRLDIYNKHKMR